MARLEGQATGETLSIPTPANAFVAEAGMGQVFLQEDRSLRLTGVSRQAWEFNVSGYKVLYRWIRARNGENLSGESGVALLRGVTDVVGRIEELISLQHEADQILERALQATLTRASIGLAPKGERNIQDNEEQA